MTAQLGLFAPRNNLPPFTAEQMAHFDRLYVSRLYDGSDLECVRAARRRAINGALDRAGASLRARKAG